MHVIYEDHLDEEFASGNDTEITWFRHSDLHEFEF